MNWYVFGLLVMMAFCMGASDGGRGLLVRRMNRVETPIAVLYAGFAVPGGLILLWFQGIPQIQNGFWSALTVSAVLHIPITLLLYYGMKKTDLSLFGGIIALAPISVLFGEWIINGDAPNTLGLYGVGVAVVGTYLLKIDKFKEGPFEPFRKLFIDPGTKLGLLMLCCFAVAVPFQRRAIRLSSPPLVLLIEMGLVATCMSVVALIVDRNWRREIHNNARLLLKTGFCWILGVICMYEALRFTLGSYVHTLRTLSVFVLLFVAAKALKEDWRRMLPGLLIIVFGVSMVALS
ncbi:MAG: hypothetical protein UT30_C0011G0020 [Candidatus Uhrbacteria bacterium GW2011_GWF2_39_13]|uniref:EamA domain-containing protein n=1 Tax=Candidatus Uhrbacteria bacterium GW2011_GWF2_39_13 TaxID=1618995 RepID=A0A0G0MJI4_9BACT|nr:MAG: hypothetical protein UT30_C0011G0020 [Candidatus Uhrbacteria bacterium GW2011_GWF2_39_13]